MALLSEHAYQENIGARGLVSAIEKVLLNYEKKLPSIEIDRFEVNADTVLNPNTELSHLLQDTSLRNFLDTFQREHQIALVLSPEASTEIEALANKREITPCEFCEDIFRDYGHGLKLAGLSEFHVSPEVVNAPQETLNALIKDYYNKRN